MDVSPPGERAVQGTHPRVLPEGHETQHVPAVQHGPAQRGRLGLAEGPQTEAGRLPHGEPGLHGLPGQHLQVGGEQRTGLCLCKTETFMQAYMHAYFPPSIHPSVHPH